MANTVASTSCATGEHSGGQRRGANVAVPTFTFEELVQQNWANPLVRTLRVAVYPCTNFFCIPALLLRNGFDG